MIRALLDTNILLDMLLDREPFVDAATEIWQANTARRFDGYISVITPVNLFYIARRLRDLSTAQYVMAKVLSVFRVCPLDGTLLREAQDLSFVDYEDAVQYVSAMGLRLDCIVTRNIRDFVSVTLPILTPDEFLTRLGSDLGE